VLVKRGMLKGGESRKKRGQPVGINSLLALHEREKPGVLRRIERGGQGRGGLKRTRRSRSLSKSFTFLLASSNTQEKRDVKKAKRVPLTEIPRNSRRQKGERRSVTTEKRHSVNWRENGPISDMGKDAGEDCDPLCSKGKEYDRFHER